MDFKTITLFLAFLIAINCSQTLANSANQWSAYSDTSSFRDVLSGRSYEDTFGSSGDPYESLFSSSLSGGYGGGGSSGGSGQSQVSYAPQEKTSVRVVQQRNDADYGFSSSSVGQKYTSPAVSVRSGHRSPSKSSSSYGSKGGGYSQTKTNRPAATKTTYSSDGPSYPKPSYGSTKSTQQHQQQRVDNDYDGYSGGQTLEIPETGFQCLNRAYGYYADVEAGCQIFHVCQPDGRKWSFFCPNHTLYHQKVQTCDWWYNVDCPASPDYYFLNERIGVLPPQDATLHRF